MARHCFAVPRDIKREGGGGRERQDLVSVITIETQTITHLRVSHTITATLGGSVADTDRLAKSIICMTPT
jgi:hypothetical protein